MSVVITGRPNAFASISTLSTPSPMEIGKILRRARPCNKIFIVRLF